jgi:hypothetical protein
MSLQWKLKMPPEMKGPARSAKAETGPNTEQRGALNSCPAYSKNLRANQQAAYHFAPLVRR